MRLASKAFWLEKQGNTPEEYEDAFAIEPSLGLFTLADGASDSAFAREWARILTQAFIAAPREALPYSDSSLAVWLERCQETWHSAVPWARLPWHGEAKAKRGAFATFLGLMVEESSLTPRKPRQWRAVAIGDTCLFHVRAGKILQAFPLGAPESFTNTPSLVCSNPRNNLSLETSVQVTYGECRARDRFFLATDALAHWILSRLASAEQPWDRFGLRRSNREWGKWVISLRSNRSIKNDDTTLISVTIR